AYNAQTRVPQILTSCIVPGTFASISVFARLYSRAMIVRSWGADDTWALTSWVRLITSTLVFGMATIGLSCAEIKFGAGRHSTILTANDNIQSLKVAFAYRITYQFSLATTKLSIGAFYLRIFQDPKSMSITYTLMGFVGLYTLALQLVVLFQCNPIAGAWSKLPAKCINLDIFFYASAVFNIVVDALLLGFVIPRLMHLKMVRKRKNALLFVVALGNVGIIAAIIRVIRISQMSMTDDSSWKSVDVTIFSSMEVNIGLICATAPAVKPL
ncbi:hypothetical protein OIDMADRAFT_81580, partial [Oidiodendron maius Zn]